MHGTVYKDHFNENDFENKDRKTGRLNLKKDAAPIAIQNINNIVAPVEDLQPNNIDVCCKRYMDKVAESEMLLQRSNDKINKLETKMKELRKKV